MPNRFLTHHYTGCNSPHFITLVPAPTGKIVIVYSQIENFISDKFGPASEWNRALRWSHRKGQLENWRRYSAILELVADTIIGHERTKLMTLALQGLNKNELRTIIGKQPRKQQNAIGKPEDVASKLTAEEQLQLIMTQSDELIIEQIDQLIASKKIRIPIGETRSPKYYSRGRSGDNISEISSLGIRSRSPSPIINLTALIWNAYENFSLINELEWKVRDVCSHSPREALTIYSSLHGPEKTVEDLILSSSTITKKICADLNLSLDLIHNNSQTVQKLLWKLGFNPNEYDDLLNRLKARLASFNEIALTISQVTNERDREQIRSVGVNLFVSLEEYLDKLISYNVWLLSSDHFEETRFVYDIDAARKKVSMTLGETSEENSTYWSHKGDNALGVLLHYLSKMQTWVSELESKPRDVLERHEDNLPHYIHDHLRPFPFRHTELWADTDLNELIKYKEGLTSITRLIHKSDLASIRNGIDHFRDEDSFPEIDKMIACATRLQQAVEKSDIGRYFPKSYSLKSKKSDNFKMLKFLYEDYRGKEFKAFGPTSVSGLKPKEYGVPVVISPGNLLGLPNSNMLFTIRELSEYSKYWEGYPRRRKIESVVIEDKDVINNSDM